MCRFQQTMTTKLTKHSMFITTHSMSLYNLHQSTLALSYWPKFFVSWRYCLYGLPGPTKHAYLAHWPDVLLWPAMLRSSYTLTWCFIMTCYVEVILQIDLMFYYDLLCWGQLANWPDVLLWPAMLRSSCTLTWCFIVTSYVEVILPTDLMFYCD